MEPKDVSKDMHLSEWLSVTLKLQRTAFGQDPPALEGDELANWLMMNFFAAVCEVVEIADETGWKPWSQPRGWVDRQKVISEVCDCLHFLGNILATVEATGEEVTAAYLNKVLKNYARQEVGDDIRLRRCPGCGRSLDDVGTVTGAGEWDSSGRPLAVATRCAACGHNLGAK